MEDWIEWFFQHFEKKKQNRLRMEFWLFIHLYMILVSFHFIFFLLCSCLLATRESGIFFLFEIPFEWPLASKTERISFLNTKLQLSQDRKRKKNYEKRQRQKCERQNKSKYSWKKNEQKVESCPKQDDNKLLKVECKTNNWMLYSNVIFTIWKYIFWGI